MTTWTCAKCSHASAEWSPQCPSCAAWMQMIGAAFVGPPAHARPRDGAITTHDVAEIDDAPRDDDLDFELPIPITAVSREHVPRFITNIPALDHVLGGGLVPGGSVLIGGDPGAAKSTLSIQAAAACARWNEARVLYVTGEENTAQVAERADRVGASFERVYLIHETDPDRILRSAEKIEPEVLIVDSISTMARLDLPAMPGSVTQVRACAELLHAWCRERHVALVLIGHVTKDGAVAGPSALKHLVDAVLHIEVIEGSQLRVLRASKNRYGDTGAVGRFMMSKDGLESIGGYGPDDSARDPAETPAPEDILMPRDMAEMTRGWDEIIKRRAAMPGPFDRNPDGVKIAEAMDTKTTDAPATTSNRESQDTVPASDPPDPLPS